MLDKEHAAGRTGVFMIDASKGFMKDGPRTACGRKTSTRSSTPSTGASSSIDTPAWCRSPRSPTLRTTTTSTSRATSTRPSPRTSRIFHAHLHGGIPDRDLDLLSPYWDAFPQLRGQLFKPNRPGYSDLTFEVGQVQQAILDSPEFQKFATRPVA